MMESNADKGILITKKIESKVLISVLVIKRSKRTDTGDYVCRTSDGQVAHKKVQVLNGRYFYFISNIFYRYHTYVCQSKGYIQCSLESVYIEILMYSLHWSSHVNQNSSRLQMNSKVNWRHWNILSLL